MVKNMITAGRKVRFDPFESLFGYGIGDLREMVTGTVVTVYPKHKWFSVVYGDNNQRISFKFCDIGGRVTVLG